MRKQITKIYLISAILFLLIIPFMVGAQEPATVYFFYGQTCPHCDKERTFLDKIEKEYGSSLDIKHYEVYYDKEGQEIFKKFVAATGGQVTGVPAAFIGDEFIVGYGSDNTTGEQIKNMINRCLAGSCPDVGAQILGEEAAEEPQDITESSQETTSLVVALPIFGEVDLAQYSLFGLTFIVAAIDGFNPCAMWVLLILIGMLLGMRNRGRMWFLGSSFIIASAFVYFIFLTAFERLF